MIFNYHTFYEATYTFSVTILQAFCSPGVLPTSNTLHHLCHVLDHVFSGMCQMALICTSTGSTNIKANQTFRTCTS